MNLSQTFTIADFNYQVSFTQSELSFALLNPPRRLLPHRADAWLMFWDEPMYEDVDFDVPVFSVLHRVKAIVSAWIRRHDIAYFECIASTERKAEVYEYLFKRSLSNEFAYQRVDQHFYVYRLVNEHC